jgi:hypothetical protein
MNLSSLVSQLVLESNFWCSFFQRQQLFRLVIPVFDIWAEIKRSAETGGGCDAGKYCRVQGRHCEGFQNIPQNVSLDGRPFLGVIGEFVMKKSTLKVYQANNLPQVRLPFFLERMIEDPDRLLNM